MSDEYSKGIQLLVAREINSHVVGYTDDQGNFKMPWRIPSDLKHFKRFSNGTTLILGYNTWLSFGKRALPGRKHLVMTRDPERRQAENKKDPNVIFCDEAFIRSYLNKFRQKNERITVAGGPQVYNLFLENGWVEYIYLTEVLAYDLEIPKGATVQTFDYGFDYWHLQESVVSEPDPQDEFTYTISLFTK